MSNAIRPLDGAARCGCAPFHKPAPMPRDERVLLSVPGMRCADSEARVRQLLAALPGVAELRCHRASASVWVRFHPERTGADALPEALVSEGVDARLMRLGAIAARV